MVDFNLDLLGTFLTYLQIRTRIVRATDLPHDGDNTDRLIQLTAAVGGDEHITSTWGTERTYIDWHRVADAGLTIRPQHYVHPTYQQQFLPFEPHLGPRPDVRPRTGLHTHPAPIQHLPLRAHTVGHHTLHDLTDHGT